MSTSCPSSHRAAAFGNYLRHPFVDSDTVSNYTTTRLFACFLNPQTTSSAKKGARESAVKNMKPKVTLATAFGEKLRLRQKQVCLLTRRSLGKCQMFRRDPT